MYKKALSSLLIWNLLFLSAYLCVCGTNETRKEGGKRERVVYEVRLDPGVTADGKSAAIGVAVSSVSEQRIVSYNLLHREAVQPVYLLKEEELELLCRIVEAEAGGEDADGKLLVANVVLNRVNHAKFPDTVSEVVLQKNGAKYQFSPVGSGRIWRVKISEETIEAVERALYGEDLSQGALYFAARKRANSDSMSWFDTHLTFLFRHGGHEFFF